MKSISYLLLIILSAGCNLSKTTSSFAGNWCTCAKDGYYIELLIKENSFKFSTGSGFTTEWNPFTIHGDALAYTQQFTPNDPLSNICAIISSPKTNEMKLDYITSDEHWTFERINENVEHLDDSTKLSEETKKRGLKKNCIDKRNKEEIERDSIPPMIDFQF